MREEMIFFIRAFNTTAHGAQSVSEFICESRAYMKDPHLMGAYYRAVEEAKSVYADRERRATVAERFEKIAEGNYDARIRLREIKDLARDKCLVDAGDGNILIVDEANVSAREMKGEYYYACGLTEDVSRMLGQMDYKSSLNKYMSMTNDHRFEEVEFWEAGEKFGYDAPYERTDEFGRRIAPSNIQRISAEYLPKDYISDIGRRFKREGFSGCPELLPSEGVVLVGERTRYKCKDGSMRVDTLVARTEGWAPEAFDKFVYEACGAKDAPAEDRNEPSAYRDTMDEYYENRGWDSRLTALALKDPEGKPFVAIAELSVHEVCFDRRDYDRWIEDAKHPREAPFFESESEKARYKQDSERRTKKLRAELKAKENMVFVSGLAADQEYAWIAYAYDGRPVEGEKPGIGALAIRPADMGEILLALGVRPEDDDRVKGYLAGVEASAARRSAGSKAMSEMMGKVSDSGPDQPDDEFDDKF